LQLSDLGTEFPATIKGYKVRKGVLQTILCEPRGRPNLHPVKKNKGYCNACWHARKPPYTHKHCSELLNNPELVDESLVELQLKIKNIN